MKRPPAPEAATSRRRLAASWQVAFALYALALTVATHWPAFVLAEQVPADDKLLHAAAFALLTWLLWRTRWIRSRSLVVLAAVLWSLLDECSQAIPILNRWATWDDAAANVAGALLAGAWLWTLRPVGGPINRMRLRLHDLAFDRLFQHPRAWLLFALMLLACAAPAAVAWTTLRPAGTRRVIAACAVVWILAAGFTLLRLWRRERQRLAAHRPCFDCGAPCPDIEFDTRGLGHCPVCGATLHLAQWNDPSPPRFRMLVGIIAEPLAIAAILAFLVLLAILLSPLAYALLLQHFPTAGAVPRAARFIGRLPSDLAFAADFALLFLLFAAAVRAYRARLARYYDSPLRCRRCGHDLHATPTSRGVGRCGECGTPFVRLDLQPPTPEGRT